MGERGNGPPKEPLHIRLFEGAFGMMFADAIAFIWYHAGLNWWHKNSKISVFSLIFLVPIIIGIFHFIDVNFLSDDDSKKDE